MMGYSVVWWNQSSLELLRHGRRAGEEEKIATRVVSGETTLIIHIETYQLQLWKTMVLKSQNVNSILR